MSAVAFFVKLNWVVLTASLVGGVVTIALYALGRIGTAQAVFITFALTWLDTVLAAGGVLVGTQVKRDMETEQ